ncbi:MAG: hypothetical protein VYC51_10330, partial [Pseudomonadota bacterium]|nr:hypothetical protein [Pseudomonadota bacterium]
CLFSNGLATITQGLFRIYEMVLKVKLTDKRPVIFAQQMSPKKWPDKKPGNHYEHKFDETNFSAKADSGSVGCCW